MNEQSQRVAAARKKNFSGIIVLAIIAVIIWIVVKVVLPGGDIKNCKETMYDAANKTYSQILDGYCGGGKWDSFTSQAYMKVVEFKGKARNGDSVLIQFSDEYGVNNGKYNIVYMEINGHPTDTMEAANWFMNAAYSIK